MQALPSLSSSDSLKCFLHAIVTALVIVFGVIAISGVIIVVFVVPSLPSCDSPSVQFAVQNNVIVVVTALVFFWRYCYILHYCYGHCCCCAEFAILSSDSLCVHFALMALIRLLPSSDATLIQNFSLTKDGLKFPFMYISELRRCTIQTVIVHLIS